MKPACAQLMPPGRFGARGHDERHAPLLPASPTHCAPKPRSPEQGARALGPSRGVPQRPPLCQRRTRARSVSSGRYRCCSSLSSSAAPGAPGAPGAGVRCEGSQVRGTSLTRAGNAGENLIYRCAPASGSSWAILVPYE